MAFDECPPGDAGSEATHKSLELTARWARRSKDRFERLQEEGTDSGFVQISRRAERQRPRWPETAAEDGGDPLNGRQALFGIIQGAGHFELRQQSLEKTVDIGFDGYAIGGLSVGEEKKVMYDVLEFITPQMPADSPRYLMGVGTPEDLVEAVGRGVDMFDCVLPTRNGRSGSAFTSRGKINIRNAKYASDNKNLDPNCKCSVCRRYSRGYLRHLCQSGEMNAAIMISHHNLAFFLDMMQKIRDAIRLGKFGEFKREFLSRMSDN